MQCPQNGDHIETRDSVTSLHPMHRGQLPKILSILDAEGLPVVITQTVTVHGLADWLSQAMILSVTCLVQVKRMSSHITQFNYRPKAYHRFYNCALEIATPCSKKETANSRR